MGLISRSNRRPVLTVLATLLYAGAAAPMSAQSASPQSEFETRTELEKQAQTAETEHRTQEAWLLRQRLQNGDFQEGDRIVFALRSIAAPTLPDTVIVRAGRIVQFPKMDDLSLDGVLRSELNERFTKYMAKYFKDPEVRTTPLLRMGVMGAVARQGYYYVSADLLVNDVIMRSGGPAPNADLAKVEIHRGTDVIWNDQAVRAALTDGLSLDRLHLRAGDEITVPARRNIQWLNIFTVSLGLIGAALSIYQFTK